METRIQIFTTAGAILFLIVVLELVRQRRLLERYALLWLGSTVLLLVLAIWQSALKPIAKLIGVIYPPNAIFVVAFAATLGMLLHFSVVISKLNDQTKVLAQRLALLEAKIKDTGAEKQEQNPQEQQEPSELSKS